MIETATGTKINFRSEMIVKTILDFNLRILGGKLLQKRNITVEMPAKKLALGEAFDVTVKCERLPFFKDAPGAGKRQVYLTLVNMTDKSMQMQLIDNFADKVEKKFKIQPQPAGSYSFRAFVMTSDGQIEACKNDGQLAIG